jgi:PAS domain S-box-containing protein
VLGVSLFATCTFLVCLRASFQAHTQIAADAASDIYIHVAKSNLDGYSMVLNSMAAVAEGHGDAEIQTVLLGHLKAVATVGKYPRFLRWGVVGMDRGEPSLILTVSGGTAQRTCLFPDHFADAEISAALQRAIDGSGLTIASVRLAGPNMPVTDLFLFVGVPPTAEGSSSGKPTRVVFGRIAPADLFGDLWSSGERLFSEVEIFDGVSVARVDSFNRPKHLPFVESPEIARRVSLLTAGGQMWTLALAMNSDASYGWLFWVLGSAGLGVTLILTAVSALQARAHQRAIVAQENLDRVQAHYAMINRISPTSIIEFDGSGLIRACNPAAEFLFGASFEELKQEHLLDWFPANAAGQSPVEQSTQLEELLACDKRQERLLVTKGGRQLAVETATIVLSGSVDAPRYVMFLTDLTDHKQYEQQLRENWRTAEILTSVGHSIMAKLDPNELNKELVAITAIHTDAILGVYFDVSEGGSLVERADLRCVRQTVSHEVLVSVEAITGHGVVSLSSKEKPWHVTRVPILDKVVEILTVGIFSRQHKMVGVVGFAKGHPAVFSEQEIRLACGVASQASLAIDNSLLYEAERTARANAEQLSKIKDDFVATLSHELRTPLNAILGWIQLLRRSNLSVQDREKGLEVVERNARHQTAMIEDLLDLSRITSGKLQCLKEPVGLQGILQTAVQSVESSVKAKRVRLEVTLPFEPIVLDGDSNRLRQVFWNLLTNAIKFTPEDGTVRLSLRRQGEDAVVTVSDSGIGISPDFLPLLFDRFRQERTGSARSHGGLGLGLSIVRQLVEMHGGKVVATSEGAGKGATFTVTLPVHGAPAGAVKVAVHDALTSPAPGVPRLLDGLRILVVDDDDDARSLARRLLEDEGAEVKTANSARDALALLDREKMDLAVSDIGMPGEDGYDFIRQLRESPSMVGNRDIPAIALTAFARTEDRKKVIESGYQSHLAKPYEPFQLIRLAGMLGGRGEGGNQPCP